MLVTLKNIKEKVLKRTPDNKPTHLYRQRTQTLGNKKTFLSIPSVRLWRSESQLIVFVIKYIYKYSN